MILAKAVPDGIKDKECKTFALQEHPPIPYVLEKDPVQEMVSTLQSDQSLKTTIGKDAELCLPIWHCGMCKAFLVHMSTAGDRIKKNGTFKAHKKACEAYVEQRKAAKQAKAALAILNATMSKGEKTSKKASQKNKEGTALADAQDPEQSTEYQADYEKAKFAAETAKNKRKAAATEMFQFYTNLLSADAKYGWNKIIKEQTEADPFKDL
jgi:hypothetical protein